MLRNIFSASREQLTLAIWEGFIAEVPTVFKTVVAAPDLFFVTIDCIVGYARQLANLSVANAIFVQYNNLFQIHWIRFIRHIAKNFVRYSHIILISQSGTKRTFRGTGPAEDGTN